MLILYIPLQIFPRIWFIKYFEDRETTTRQLSTTKNIGPWSFLYKNFKWERADSEFATPILHSHLILGLCTSLSSLQCHEINLSVRQFFPCDEFKSSRIPQNIPGPSLWQTHTPTEHKILQNHFKSFIHANSNVTYSF